MDYKICTKCKNKFPATAEYFHRNKTTADGLNRQCKNCINEYQRERVIREKEKLKRKYTFY